MAARLLLISPVRNEEAHIERVAAAVARQTAPPASWIVIDDGSEDSTLELLRSLERRIHFMTVMSAPHFEASAESRDRLAVAAEARAFNIALHSVDWATFSHIGKLDGDVEPSPRHFERLLREFDHDPALGLAGAMLLEPRGRGWRRLAIPASHVHGAVKLYSRECFTAIGGIEERLGWDTIDGVYARMRGFHVRSFPEVVARHHRPHGTASGRLRGRARHGECAYIAHQAVPWVLLRSIKVAASPPIGLSGAAFLYGFARAALGPTDNVEDDEFRAFVRRDLRRRLTQKLSVRAA